MGISYEVAYCAEHLSQDRVMSRREDEVVEVQVQIQPFVRRRKVALCSFNGPLYRLYLRICGAFCSKSGDGGLKSLTCF